MSKQDQIDVMELMAKHEEILGQLYDAYGTQLPDHYEFWKRFRDEEEIHAQWIRDFIKEVKDGKAEIDPRRFPAKAITNSIKYIGTLKSEAMQGAMTFEDQLEVALVMERGLLKDKYFEVIETDGPHLKILLDKLRIATDVHSDRIFEELGKQRI